MKRLALAVVLAALLILCTGCSFLYRGEKELSSREGELKVPSSPSFTPAPVLPQESEAENINLLTGEATLSPEAVGKRPVAVMVNNSWASLPQYGISEADLIFEIPVEGGVTRLMALYGDYTAVPEVCSVRSCRYYYPILAVGYDAYYVHWGQDETIATKVLNYLEIDRMDGMVDTYGLYYRDEDRLEQGFDYEHTGMFYGPGLKTALEENQVRTELQENKTEPFFEFLETPKVPGEKECKALTVWFSGDYFSTFQYQENSHLYHKEFSGEEHRDAKTGEILCFENLFLLETEISVRDEVGRLDVDWHGGKNSTGYYVSEGAVVPIHWEKEGEYSDLSFTTSEGQPLPVNPGKSYVAFCSPGDLEFMSSSDS